MANQLFGNNLKSALSLSTAPGSLTSAATGFTLVSGGGNNWPTPSAGDYTLVTLYEVNGLGLEINHEIVKVTNRTADTFTIDTRDFEQAYSGVGRSFPDIPANNPSGVVYAALRYTAYAAGNTLNKDDNLASLVNKPTARTNLGLGNVDNTSNATERAAVATLTNKTIAAATNTITTAASGNLTSTNLNAALAELQSDIDTRATATALTTHTGLATGAHAASAISYAGGIGLSATNVEAAIDELATEKANSADLSASTGSSLSGHIASGTGATARTVQSKLRDTVSVADFGAVGDGVTDDSTAIQNAINSLANGGIVSFPVGKYYVASTISVTSNVTLQGVLGSVGGQAHSSQNFNNINNIIYLASTATIEVLNATAVKNIAIMASNLRGVLPFANSAAASAGVAAFTGVGVTCKGSDVYLAHLIILGFTTAIKSNNGATNWYRQKFEWIDIDCTNGIDIYKSADVPRIANIHCWDFLTFNVGLGDYSLRSGTAFKVASNFDEGHFTNCFSFGFAIGFDINAITDVTLLDCGVDSWAANPVNPLQIGVKVQGTVTQVKIIGGAYSAVNRAVDMSSAGSLIITGGAQFLGNKTHVYATSGRLSITGNSFNYVNSGWGGTTAIQIVAASAPPLITSNVFDSVPYAYVLSTGASSITEQAVIWGNQFNNGASDPFIGERLQTSSGIATKTITNYSDNATGQALRLRKSRGTASAQAIVATNDAVAHIASDIWTGTSWVGNAAIRSFVEGTPSATSAPGGWIFSTAADGTTSMSDRLKLSQNGFLFPLSDNAYQLGASGFRWASVWAANGTIQTSDVRTKDNIKPASLGLDFINKLNPVSYTWKQGSVEVVRQVYRDADGNEVDANTEGANPAEIITKEKAGTRTHWGLIAQEVKQVVDGAGVDFAGWVLSDFDDKDSQQALRYDQFISPLIKAVQELTARVKALENV